MENNEPEGKIGRVHWSAAVHFLTEYSARMSEWEEWMPRILNLIVMRHSHEVTVFDGYG